MSLSKEIWPASHFISSLRHSKLACPNLKTMFTGLSLGNDWWAVLDSNQRPPVCKTDAIPTELTALKQGNLQTKENCNVKDLKSQNQLIRPICITTDLGIL